MSVNYNFLTSKQKKVYSAIESYIKTKGIPPTVREIGELIGEKTPGAVQGILKRLEQKGAIKRGVGMARSIQLVSDTSNYAESGFIPEIKKITSRNIGDLLNIYNINKYHPVSKEFFPDVNNMFMITCPDNSLNEFSYTDMLYVNKTPELGEGDIVLVLFDNHVLLRKYYKADEEDKITLRADNDFTGREIFSNDEVIIIGKVIGKYTKY